jgi:hypothetical protein
MGFSGNRERLDGSIRAGYRNDRPGTVFRDYNFNFQTFWNFSHDVRFAARLFHFVERPQLFGACFEPFVYFSPIKACVSLHVVLKARLQHFEKLVAILRLEIFRR